MKKRITIVVDEGVYHKFKIYAVKNRKTISSEIENLLQNKVKEKNNGI